MFLYSDQRWASRIGGGPFHLEHYPDSLASRYMRATSEVSDYAAMSRVVRQAARERPAEQPPADAVVVHLRAGDVMDLAGVTIGGADDYHTLRASDVLSGRASAKLHHYTYPLSYFTNLVPQLPRHVRLAYLCAGAQYPSDHGWPISTAYVNAIRDALVQRGFRVRAMVGRNPDDEVLFMSAAKHFIRAGGGYSAVVAALVQRNGGQVYWDGHPGRGVL